MIEAHSQKLIEGYPAPCSPKIEEAKTLEDLMPHARFIAKAPEWRRNKVGFVGYGKTKPDDGVLIAADTIYDP